MSRNSASRDMMVIGGTKSRWIGVRVKNGHRLCLGCLESWTYSTDPLCPACKIEHDLAWEVQPSGWTGGLEPKEWWGPTRHDIDEEDLEFGFYATSATEGDMPLALDEYRD